MAEPKIYCEDFSCPSRWSCTRFWGAAKEYHAFDVEATASGRVATKTFRRNPKLDSCQDYRRVEAPRPWLLLADSAVNR